VLISCFYPIKQFRDVVLSDDGEVIDVSYPSGNQETLMLSVLHDDKQDIGTGRPWTSDDEHPVGIAPGLEHYLLDDVERPQHPVEVGAKM
jgi:hypothetical protein